MARESTKKELQRLARALKENRAKLRILIRRSKTCVGLRGFHLREESGYVD